MTDDAVKKLLSALASLAKQPKRARRNFSVYLDEEQFRAFKVACREQDASASEVLDGLISLYMSARKTEPGHGEP